MVTPLDFFWQFGVLKSSGFSQIQGTLFRFLTDPIDFFYVFECRASGWPVGQIWPSSLEKPSNRSQASSALRGVILELKISGDISGNISRNTPGCKPCTWELVRSDFSEKEEKRIRN